MKVSRAHKKGGLKRWRVVLISGALVLLTAAGIGGYWWNTNTEIRKSEVAVAELATQVEARLAEIEAKKKEPVYLTLPGADAIRVPVEDYEAFSHVWTLVNKNRALPADYMPSDLVTPDVRIRTASEQVRTVVAAALVELFADAENEGHILMVGSSYRSYSTQEWLFSSYVAASGYALADKYSAHAGHSEHQTGLAVDVSTASQSCYLEECFTDTGDGRWLADNAYKYGFILRYPLGKEEITGYNFEPWHFRYVGIPLATAIHQSGLTLDEAWPYMLQALSTLRNNRAL